MPDSSENESAYYNIKFGNLLKLIELTRDSRFDSREYIGRRYSENAQYFEETLGFLTMLGWIRFRGDSLAVESTIKEISNVRNAIVVELLRRICEPHGKLRGELQQYFAQFKPTNGFVAYQPHNEFRGFASHLRNLLLDLNVLSYDASSDFYFLNPAFYDLYKRVAPRPPAVTPQFAEELRTAATDLGISAEHAVVLFERERLGPAYAHHVEHISIWDASAGYDIASVTSVEGEVHPRLIEVKAVPELSLRFYWSANEVAAARWFGDWYYIYLIPVVRSNHFDLGQMRVVQNPCAGLTENSGWILTPDSYKCELMPDTSRD